MEVRIKNEPPKAVEVFLECDGCGGVNLMVNGIDGENWVVATLGEDGALELVDGICAGSGLKVDKGGYIKTTKSGA